MIDQFVSLRFGTPPEIQFPNDADKWDYGRNCQKIRDELPAGEMRVAPRVSIRTWRGRPLESGAAVVAADFSDSDESRERLRELIFAGKILASDNQTDEERAAVFGHAQQVRDLNAAFVSDTPAAKLDALLSQQQGAKS